MNRRLELEELDVEGILAFAERVLPSVSNLWVQATLNQKQRLQQVLFPFPPVLESKKEVVDQNSASWNPLISWLRLLDRVRGVA